MSEDRRGDGVWAVIFLVLLVVGAKPAADTAKSRGHHHHAPPPAATSTAGRLSPAAIYSTARRARFSPATATTATAVALAESGGRPRAHNPVPPDDSYCLMQINMLGDLGPARRARYHLSRNEDLYDPLTCMRVAYAISGGGADWTPWTTYTRGSYRQHLARARQAGRG